MGAIYRVFRQAQRHGLSMAGASATDENMEANND